MGTIKCFRFYGTISQIGNNIYYWGIEILNKHIFYSINLFYSKNWLAKKKVFKSVIEPELFITTIVKHEAPQAVIEEFLNSMDNAEMCLEIAKKVKCHKYVIDYYIKQRDRLGLLAYKTVIPSQSQDYFYLENALVVI